MVGLYFNTNNMSAILKALQNRKVEVELKSEVVELGIADDLEAAVKNLNGTLDTGEKVVDASIKANAAIKKVEQDVKFYNKYARITYEDINSGIKYVESLKAKAEKAAKELGVNVEDIKGYKKASAFVIDAKSVGNKINQFPLNFDI